MCQDLVKYLPLTRNHFRQILAYPSLRYWIIKLTGRRQVITYIGLRIHTYMHAYILTYIYAYIYISTCTYTYTKNDDDVREPQRLKTAFAVCRSQCNGTLRNAKGSPLRLRFA